MRDIAILPGRGQSRKFNKLANIDLTEVVVELCVDSLAESCLRGTATCYGFIWKLQFWHDGPVQLFLYGSSNYVKAHREHPNPDEVRAYHERSESSQGIADAP